MFVSIILSTLYYTYIICCNVCDACTFEGIHTMDPEFKITYLGSDILLIIQRYTLENGLTFVIIYTCTYYFCT